MTITFDNDNEVIVYALEKIITYARQHQYIFVAHSVWWLASIIGLEQGLIIHIDNLKSRSDIALRDDTLTAKDTIDQIDTSCCRKAVSATPRNIQENSTSYNESGHIHQDRISQVQNRIFNIRHLQSSSSSLDQHLRIA